MKSRAYLFFLMLFFISFVGGVSSNAASSNNNSNQTTTQTNQQKIKGVIMKKGQIKGVIMNYDTKKPVSGHQVCLLAPKGSVKADGWQAVDDLKIEVTTSEDGSFIFKNINPGKYILMLKYSGLKPINYASVRHENAKGVEVKLDSDQIIDVGKVWVQMR